MIKKLVLSDTQRWVLCKDFLTKTSPCLVYKSPCHSMTQNNLRPSSFLSDDWGGVARSKAPPPGLVAGSLEQSVLPQGERSSDAKRSGYLEGFAERGVGVEAVLNLPVS